jgi:hypothetical protein
MIIILTLIGCTIKEEKIISKDNDIEKEVEVVEATRIRMLFRENEIVVKMMDNPSTTDFLKLLPIELIFEDYNNTEKITYLPSKLSSDSTSSGITPQVGDFAYYAPWGNLAIYYKGFSYSSGLVLLGQIEEGIENLELIENNELVKIEIISD